MFLTVFISDLDAQEELHYNLRALVGQLRFNFMSKLVAFPRACELLDLTSSLGTLDCDIIELFIT